MYRNRLRKFALGDYVNNQGVEGNYLTNNLGLASAQPYMQLGSQLVNTIDPANSYGVKSNTGAALSGGLTGAAAGTAILPGIGTAVGGVIGAVGSIIGNNKRKEEQEKAETDQRRLEVSNINQYSRGVLANYPSNGIAAKYGMKMPNGGTLPYPTTKDTDVEVLSSNMAQYEGNTHENGGIPLDNNIEIEDQEVIKDDMVLSDRLYPSKLSKSLVKGLGITIKDNDTYASLSARLGKNKGKFEKNLNSTRIGEKGTAQLMVSQLDNAINTLFKDQQLQKEISGIDSEGNKLQNGGEIKAQPGLATKLYDEYDKDIAKAYTDKYGPGFSFTDSSQAYLGFKDNNSLTPQMLVRSKVSTPSLDYGKQYKFNDHTQDGYSVMNALREDGYLPKDKVMRAYGGLTDPKTDPKTDKDGNPIFKTQKEHNSYWVNKQLETLSPEDKQWYDDTVAGKVTNIDANSIIALRSKIPTFPEWKNPKPQNDGPLYNVLGRSYYKNGGYLKKMALGDYTGTVPRRGLTNDPIYLNMQDAINGLPNFNPSPIDNGGGTIETLRPDVQVSQPEKIPFMERLDNNLGNLANGIGFLANNAQINQLETEYKPTLTQAPNYNFNSRLPYLSNQVKSAYRTATQGIKGSGAQDNQTLQSNLFAKTLSSLNQATSDEFARKDQYDARYNELSNRTNLMNTNIVNQSKFASQDNRNQKVALKQQNTDSLIRGIIGNKTVKDQQELDFAKNYMELLKGDSTGVSKRFLEQVPAKFRRKYIGNYYNN